MGVRAVRHAGALPHVSGGHYQQPHPAGGVRRGRRQGGLLRQRDRPVRHAIQPPSGGGKRSACRGGTGAFAGVFQRPAGAACGKAEVETAGTAGAEYEKTVKKWKLREKAGGFHFLFSANCAILFNGVLSKPILCSCLPRRAPDFDRIRNGR